MFPISRDPPEGGTLEERVDTPNESIFVFPISRDPPEGGTGFSLKEAPVDLKTKFPISRDPPEGGTLVFVDNNYVNVNVSNF